MDIIALVFNVLALRFAYRQLSFFSEMFMDLLLLLAPGKRLGSAKSGATSACGIYYPHATSACGSW